MGYRLGADVAAAVGCHGSRLASCDESNAPDRSLVGSFMTANMVERSV